MGGALQSTLSPEKLLKEMAGLWITLGKESGGEAGAGVLRACSMTLVVAKILRRWARRWRLSCPSIRRG